MPAAIELPPDYYLSNFRSLTDFVARHYWELLLEQEREFYRSFQGAGPDAQKLYVRLLSRKGDLFRFSKLSYPEIESIERAAGQLAELGLLALDPPMPLASMLGLFTKAELGAAAAILNGKAASVPSLPVGKAASALRRAELEALLLEAPCEAELKAQLLKGGETLFQLRGEEYFTCFRLCFFGNLRQDLTDYVLRDLGLYRYEPYRLDRDNLPFQSRQQIDRHLTYYACRETADAVLQQGVAEIIQLWREMPACDPDDATLTRRVERLTLSLARQLERLEAYVDAEQLYSQCRHPPARERCARIALKCGHPNRALAICRDILTQPVNEGERDFAEQFGSRVAKKIDRPWPCAERYRPSVVSVALARDGRPVELIAAEHLGAGGECFYVENTLFTGVLGLFVWDIVFAPVPGAFFNPFQIAPNDFHSPDFVTARRERLTRRLADVDDRALRERVLSVYREKFGTANPLVNWPYLSEALLELALARIPVADWMRVFERLLNDIHHHRAGLPDLILFPAGGGFELVEVKGPGDKLQENQIRWMRFFARCGIAHRVLAVEWQP